MLFIASIVYSKTSAMNSTLITKMIALFFIKANLFPSSWSTNQTFEICSLIVLVLYCQGGKLDIFYNNVSNNNHYQRSVTLLKKIVHSTVTKPTRLNLLVIVHTFLNV